MAWGFRWLETLLQDLRNGLRQLRRNPGFTVVAVITLALGIGASTAIFSVVYPVMVDPYPYQGAGRMVDFAIVGKAKGDERDWYSTDEFQAVRDQSRVFDGLVAYNAFHKVLTKDILPEVVFVVQMNGDAFRYFGVAPLLGRAFTAADAPWGKPPAPVAVISFRFWQAHYASARDVLGKTLWLDGKPYTIIGVLPRRFAWHNAQIYLPYDQSWKYVWIGARLRPGVTPVQATADLDLIFHQMVKLQPHEYPLDGFSVKVQGLDQWALGSFRENLLLLVAAVGLLLLIACSNTASLLLARGSVREAEFALRASLGANRGRIIRQLLTESVVLSLAGGVLGIMLAYFGVHLLVSIMPPSGVPPEAAMGVNGPALLFAASLSVAVGSLCGLAPALRSSKSKFGDSLGHSQKGGVRSGGRDRTHNSIIMAECGIAMVLLASAALTFKSFLTLRTTRLGFDPSKILTMDIPVNWGTTEWQARVARLSAILSEVKALPGVQTAALSMSTEPPPLQGFLHTPAKAAGGAETHVVQMNLVSPEFFQVFQVSLIQGRPFTNAELQAGRQVAVVNQSMAKLLWLAGENPIGREVHVALGKWEVDRIGRPPGLSGWCQVVGIAGDTLNDGVQQPAQPAVFIPYSLLVDSEATLTLRTTSNPLLLAKSVRSAIAADANGQPITNLSRYSDYLADVTFSHDRFSAVLFLVFGAFGLVLCASGIYGVVSFTLSRRTHEIGIRMALGAQRGQVLRTIIRDTMAPVFIGFGLGLLGSEGMTRYIASQLPGVRATDAATLAVASAILGAVAFAAGYIPARRATKVDPMVVLRYE